MEAIAVHVVVVQVFILSTSIIIIPLQEFPSPLASIPLQISFNSFFFSPTTEVFQIAQFLHRQRVSVVTSSACECGWHYNRQRMFEEAGTTNSGKVVSIPKGRKAVLLGC